ncbi:MAG: response regulator [Eubacterium sp.]|nr:response regulator [Eubacterium sp.]
MKKHQRMLLSILIILCMGIILAGGVLYLRTLQDSLSNNAIQSVISATVQQRQSFDEFIIRDREQLYGYADYFSEHSHGTPEDLQQLLTLFKGTDAECIVTCLDEGWTCGSLHSDILQLDEETLDIYRNLPASGVRDNYIGIFSDAPKFSYYETFTFHSGHKGFIQKEYNRSKILETFTLSLYDGRGYGYLLNQQGDILLRSVPNTSGTVYSNVFDALTDTHSAQKDIDTLAAALNARETGSITFQGDNGRFIYTYTPLESVNDWYMLSIVPLDAINAETEGILQYSQMSLIILVVIVFICVMFALLVRRTQRDMQAKDNEIAYQEQLFDIFATYLSNNTNDVYLMLDHETHNLEYISPNAERVMGVKPEELIDYIHSSDLARDPDETQEYYAKVMDLGSDNASLTRNTERIDPRTGERKYYLETAYCTTIQGQMKWVSYISDRTNERKTQDSLAEALEMAQTANKAKTAFLSNVSHDIRTPMNAITGFLSLIKEEDIPEAVKDYVQRIDAASQHLLGLINDVLDMNKIESGNTTLSISEMDMAEIIEEINTIIRPQAKAKNQTFDIFVSHLEDEFLLGDKMRINQILINLLSNAVKYTPNGGTIQLRVEELSQIVTTYRHLRFTVSDNGLGMSEEYQKVIFEPFTREETKITHEIQGTGLGMAITRSLVELMGGVIHVESAQGKGSTFTIDLELRIQQKEEEDPGFWNDHKVSRMIVTDDEEEVCLNIVKVMSKVGVSTDYATDGETAVRMMRERREAGIPYDLILLDWQMPNLNGLETARLIRQNYSDKIPILLLSAYDWSEIENEAIEIGISHFMPKPFFMSTFKDTIRRVMGVQKKEQIRHADVVRGKKILVVDDIDTNRMILVKILSSLGAVCDTVTNGQEAVDAFEKSQPGDYDLILMDVQMPVMNGYDATRAIRNSSSPSAKTIPIIAMTANAFVDDVREALEAGMDAHIAKPVQLDKLKTTIQQVLDSRQGQTN